MTLRQPYLRPLRAVATLAVAAAVAVPALIAAPGADVRAADATSVTVPTTAGKTVSETWTGTIPPGANPNSDCTGQPDGRVGAVKSARIWGRVCFVGEGNTTTFEISPDIIHKQLTIYGSWTFSSVGQAECAQFIVDHELALESLLTDRFSLPDAVDAYKRFDTQTTGKGVFLRN